MKQRQGRRSILCLVIVVSVLVAGCKEDVKDLYQTGMKAYQAEKYQKAADTFEALLKKYPDQNVTRKVRYELGNLYFYKLQQPELALKHLQILYAQSQQPGKYGQEALMLMGTIYDKSLNDCPQAIKVYQELVTNYAMSIPLDEYTYNIAECYFKLHEYEQAMSAYQRIVTEHSASPLRPRANFQLANSFALLEQWEQAIGGYEDLLDANETLAEQLRVEISLELAFCYEHQEQYKQALALYQKLQALDPKAGLLDPALLERKIERVQNAITASQKEPGEVNWKR